MPSQSDVVSRCESDDIRLVRLLYVGNDGVVRGHVVDGNRIAHSFEHGENLATVVQSLTATDVVAPTGEFGATGEVRLRPDPTTFRPLPYADRTAAMLCDLSTLDGEQWVADPRSTLGEYSDSLAERGLTARLGFESEFYLLVDDGTDAGPRPVDDSPCYAAEGMQTVDDVILATLEALDDQGIPVGAYHPELGPGQQEFVQDHAAGLAAVDDHLFLRRTVQAVARAHGLDASFAPKPLPDAAGNGCHVHLSLWADGRNVFFDAERDSPYGLSETGRYFVGGLLEHAPSLVALTAASPASYRRLQPSSWASAYTCWGADNREAVVRVPSADRGRREASTRVEFKPSDHTANPYLAVVGILAAGMDGIDGEIDPGRPLDVDPATLGESELRARGIERLPESLDAALDALAADEVLTAALGETLVESYIAVKRARCETSGSGTGAPSV
jgi:glutamine synthetase